MSYVTSVVIVKLKTNIGHFSLIIYFRVLYANDMKSLPLYVQRQAALN